MKTKELKELNWLSVVAIIVILGLCSFFPIHSLLHPATVKQEENHTCLNDDGGYRCIYRKIINLKDTTKVKYIINLRPMAGNTLFKDTTFIIICTDRDSNGVFDDMWFFDYPAAWLKCEGGNEKNWKNWSNAGESKDSMLVKLSDKTIEHFVGLLNKARKINHLSN